MRLLRRRPPSVSGLRDIIPHGSFDTYNVGGTVLDETVAADGQDRLYQSGGGYTGAILGFAAWDGSSRGIQCMLRSWHMDFVANRDGVNSSPFPSYGIMPNIRATALDFRDNGVADQDAPCSLFIGNSFSVNWHVYGTAGSTLKSTTLSSSYAVAGAGFRFAFDFATDTISCYGHTSGDFSNLSLLDSYTFTPTDRSNMVNEVSRFGIAASMRADPDGWRDIRFYEV